MDSANLIVLGALFILAQFIHARIVITAIEAAERRIIEHMDSPLEIEDDLAVWTEVDLPPIDERDFG